MPNIKLLIKNPAGNTSLTLEVSADVTLAELHGLLAEGYEGKPPPAAQTLIFAGKVLKDPTVTIRKLIEKQEPFEGPHSFHLVVRKPQEPAAASTSTANTSTGPSTEQIQASAEAASSSSSSSNFPQPIPSSSASASASAATSSPSPAASATSTSTGSPGLAAPPQPQPQAQASAAPQADVASSLYPYMYVNPIYAAAYQAAYAAAMAASMQAGAMQSPGLGQQPFHMPYYMSAMYPPGYMPYSGSPGQHPQQHMHGMQLPYPYGAGAGAGGAPPPSMVAHIIQGGPNGPEIRIEGLPQDALGPVAMALANLRQRRGLPAAPAGGGGAAPHNHNQVHVHMRPRRPRGVTLRISARTILQVLVLAMVIYQQQFSTGRLVAFLVVGVVVYFLAVWEPLRRLLASLQLPPRPAAGAAGAAANGAAPAQQPGAGAEAGPAAAAPAAAAAVQRPRAWVVVHELLVLILGLLTSLLPTWNYNPDDAAAFAAAQAIAARDDLLQQQQAAAGELGAGDAVADQADAAAPAQPAQPAAQPDAANVEPAAA